MYNEIIIKNAVWCGICKTEAVSTHRHHFARCRCGNIAADGGDAYRRRVGAEGPWTDTSILADPEPTAHQLSAAIEILHPLKAGALPPADVLGAAPLLENWRLVVARREYPEGLYEMEGIVTGHPKYRDGYRLRTPPLLMKSADRAWALTLAGTYYRLGDPDPMGVHDAV
ncbi:hypothetical protein [Devosia sp. SD17-2]|uniref:DUF7695 domain-containing protein n=1 Tax=Devosia sp. SD17-2 TaxID=2976459 RepID=UPI0023D8075C|nr:hypothetical protein [Devosia sp. SD17-2]WEJ31720.1 hypothetical protein NYQ88_12475 [Devosia sp. SD17-2]